MMTSPNGSIFRVTGPLWGKFTGPGEFPTHRPVTRSFDVFFDLRLNKPLSKQSWGWWFETLSRSLWRHRNDLAWEIINVKSSVHSVTKWPVVRLKECIISPQILRSPKKLSLSIGMRSAIPSSYIGNHQSKMLTDWSCCLVNLMNNWVIIVRYVALCHYSCMIETINNTYNFWWSNRELSICPLDRVQNWLSDNGKLRKITL